MTTLLNPPAIEPSNRHTLSKSSRGVLLTHVLVGGYIVIASIAPYLYGRLLAAILVVGLMIALLKGAPLRQVTIHWLIALSLLGGAGTLNGLLRGNDGALATATVFIIEPLLIGTLLSALIRRERDVDFIKISLDAALVAVFVVGFLLYLREITGAPVPVQLFLDERFSAIDVTDGHLRSNYQGFNSLIFLGPYGLARTFLGRAALGNSVYGCLIATSSVGATLLAGRSILYLSSPLALVATLIITHHRHRQREAAKYKTILVAAATVVCVLVVLSLLGISISTARKGAISEISLDDSSGVRPEQARLLTAKWLESPVIGHGTGATIDGYARNVDAPWQFELSYHLLLVNFGMVGIVMLIAWVTWTLRVIGRSTRSFASPDHPILAGYVGALVASLSNPYLFKIDGIWMVLVPFGLATFRHAQLRTMRVSKS